MLGINSQGNSRFRRSPESVFYLKRTQTRISGVHPLSSPMVFWFPHSGFFCGLKLPGLYSIWTYGLSASSVIASSQEHLNGQQNAGRAVTHGGMACWVTGLRCERSGVATTYCSPYFASDRLFWLGVRVMTQTGQNIKLRI